MAFALFAADPETPSWAAQVLVQFPIVGIVFVAVWWAVRTTDRRHGEFRKEQQEEAARHREIESRQAAALTEAVQQLRDFCSTAIGELREVVDKVLEDHERRQLAELDRLRKSHDEHLKSKNAEIRRLVTLLTEGRRTEGK